MQVLVRSLEKTLVVSLEEGSTLRDLKNAIENVEFIPVSLQCLVKDSSPLTDGYLEDMITDKDTVTLLMGIDAGMRAKWRKKRMRRLRRKRRKMRMRAK
jgi:hypothetical protein